MREHGQAGRDEEEVWEPQGHGGFWTRENQKVETGMRYGKKNSPS